MSATSRKMAPAERARRQQQAGAMPARRAAAHAAPAGRRSRSTPVTAVAAPTASAVPATRAGACGRDRCRGSRAASSPSVSASSARPTEQQQADAGQDQRRRQPHLRQAAVGERAHQPEHHLHRGERILRQVERERDERRGDAGDGEAGEDQRHRSAVRAGQRHHASIATAAPISPPSGSASANACDSPRWIASTAPSAAPPETPTRLGSASGLRR